MQQHKIMANENKVKTFKVESKEPHPKLVGLKIIGFQCGDECLKEYSKFIMKELIQSREKFVDFRNVD